MNWNISFTKYFLLCLANMKVILCNYKIFMHIKYVKNNLKQGDYYNLPNLISFSHFIILEWNQIFQFQTDQILIKIILSWTSVELKYIVSKIFLAVIVVSNDMKVSTQWFYAIINYIKFIKFTAKFTFNEIWISIIKNYNYILVHNYFNVFNSQEIFSTHINTIYSYRLI